jgi:hypothetical protein
MNYFNDAKYFGNEIVFSDFSKNHFLFADSHVIPDSKLGCRDSNPLSPGLLPAPYCEVVSVGHSRRRHTSCRVDFVIISPAKFRQNIYIPVGIGDRKISEKSISDRPVSTFYDRTFHVGISVNLKLNALITYQVLKMLI